VPGCTPTQSGFTANRLSPYKPPQELINYPVIDIHTHTFNARYLPIRNIIRARRLEYPQLAHVSEPVLLGIGNILVDITRLSRLTKEQQTAAMPLERLEEKASRTGELVTPLQAVTRSSVAPDQKPAKEMTAKAVPPKEVMLVGPNQNTSSNLREFVQLMLPEEKRINESPEKAVAAGSGAEPIVRFLGFVTSSEKRLAKELSGIEFDRRVRLFVHHTMDLGPVFGEPPDHHRFLDFQTEQLPRARELDREMSGKFLHFVAWNPYRRPNDPKLDSLRPLSIVSEAVARGAWGVKFYPPSGYRPDQNDIPSRPAPGVLREQWEARYAMIPSASLSALNERLNEINERLFAWAEKYDIPIFSHSAGGEFNAAAGYGQRNANPVFWRTVLQRHPRLRLCLAHAGGSDLWFHRSIVGNGSWGQETYDLCTQYPNVYCEFGAQDEVLDSGRRDAFVRRISDFVEKSETLPYHFADKIMYGSDWFMPTRAAPRSLYLDMYREALLKPELRNCYKRFFCLNAMRYLRLEERLGTQANLTPEMRATLRKLIADSAK